MRVSVFALLMLAVVGCGAQGPFSGTYEGDAALTLGMQQTEKLTVTLSQSGNQVSGTWISSFGVGGSLAGTGDNGRLNPVSWVVPEVAGRQTCAGTFTGSGNAQGDSIVFVLVGATARCNTVSASFTLTRVGTTLGVPQ